MTVDMVSQPPHYRANKSGVEVIQLNQDLSYCVGNAFKYVARYRYKGNPVQDLEKAAFYIRHEIERLKLTTIGYYLEQEDALLPEDETAFSMWSKNEDNELVVAIIHRLWYARFTSRPDELLETALGYVEQLLEEVGHE